MLLYPHHDGLNQVTGVQTKHRIVSTSDILSTAAIGLADLGTCLSQAVDLIRGTDIPVQKMDLHVGKKINRIWHQLGAGKANLADQALGWGIVVILNYCGG